jgi:hypothetical protein
MLTVVNYTVSPNAKRLFDMNRQGMEAAKSSPKEEPGLGATAFSASTKSTVVIAEGQRYRADYRGARGSRPR